MGIIYLIRNTLNGKVYVGQTKNGLKGRWSDHVYSARHGSEWRIHQAIRKHGPDAFTIEQIEAAETDVELNAKETALIAVHRSCDYLHGYNMEPGGFGISEARREKLRVQFSGAGNPMFGKPGTRGHAGKRHSEESLRKMSKNRSMRLKKASGEGRTIRAS
jgi:group I intron endonuclease